MAEPEIKRRLYSTYAVFSKNYNPWALTVMLPGFFEVMQFKLGERDSISS